MTRMHKDTPVELIIPVAGVDDHGIDLTHDLFDKPSTVVHRVSTPETDGEAVAYLRDAGYRELCGWVRKADSTQMWTWTKVFDLTVWAW